MNIRASFDHLLKIIIIGNSGVGKSNFIFRFVDDRFSKIYQTTVGIDLKTKICTLPKSKKNVKLQIWDTAGQERFMSLNKLFFQKVQGIILMYDITNRDSYEDLPKWVQLIEENAYNIPVILIGNKLDDEDENRIVKTQEGENFANDNGFLFYESSALNGKNVNNALFALCERILSSSEESFNIEDYSESSSEIFTSKDIKKKDISRKESCC